MTLLLVHLAGPLAALILFALVAGAVMHSHRRLRQPDALDRIVHTGLPACLAHPKSCANPVACDVVTAAEFATRGYRDFDRWRGVDR